MNIKHAGILLLVLMAVGVAAMQQVASSSTTLAGIVPSGPSLVLEAADFASLVHDWQGSREKTAWLASDNYKTFARSVLLLRLEQVRDEFAGAANMAPDMSLVESVAGSRSILALYNLREIEFLYITRMSTAKAVQTALWNKRNDYQPRQSAGVTYYTRAQGGRQVAFAATDDYLILATREDLVGRCLALMKNQAGNGAAVTNDAWFSQAIAAAGQPGDLRLAVDLQVMARAPQFRTYWIQDNVAELRPYRSAVSDLRRESGEMREERVMLRVQPSDAPAALTPAITQMIPQGAGLYRVWAAPSVDTVVAMLRQKVLAPTLSREVVVPVNAPQLNLNVADVAGAGDLETRIDEAPLAESSGKFDDKPLRKLLSTSVPRAMLVAQTARDIPGGVFEGTGSVVVIESNAWDAAAVREALGNRASVREHFLIVGNAGAVTPPLSLGQGAVYAAGFAHAQERTKYIKMMKLMDQPNNRMMLPPGAAQAPDDDAGDANDVRAPQYFSENLASLSNTLRRMTDVSIVVRDTGRALQQTVVYRMAQ